MPSLLGEIDLAGLWQAYRSSRSVSIRNQIILQHLGLVHRRAAAFAKRLPTRVRMEEIASAGVDGLLQAIDSFDPDRAVTFATFATHHITGAIIDWLRSTDIRRPLRQFSRRHAAAADALASRLTRPPTDQELADEMGLPLARFLTLARQTRAARHVSLYTAGHDGDRRRDRGLPADPACALDYDDPTHGDPAQAVARELLAECASAPRPPDQAAGPRRPSSPAAPSAAIRADRRQLAPSNPPGLAARLSPRERYVIGRYYAAGETLRQIGVTLGVTQARIKQVRDKALSRLHRAITAETRRCQPPTPSARQPLDRRSTSPRPSPFSL